MHENAIILIVRKYVMYYNQKSKFLLNKVRKQ